MGGSFESFRNRVRLAVLKFQERVIAKDWFQFVAIGLGFASVVIPLIIMFSMNNKRLRPQAWQDVQSQDSFSVSNYTKAMETTIPQKSSQEEKAAPPHFFEIDPTRTTTFRSEELQIAFEYNEPSVVKSRYGEPEEYIDGLVTVTDDYLFDGLEVCNERETNMPCITTYASTDWWESTQLLGEDSRRFAVILSRDPFVFIEVHQMTGGRKLELAWGLEEGGMLYQKQLIISSIRNWDGGDDTPLDFSNREHWRVLQNDTLRIRLRYPLDIIHVENDHGIKLSYSGPRQRGGTEHFDGYSLDVFSFSAEADSPGAALQELLRTRGLGYTTEIKEVETGERIIGGWVGAEVLRVDGYPLNKFKVLAVATPEAGNFVVIDIWFNDYSRDTDFDQVTEDIINSVELLW